MPLSSQSTLVGIDSSRHRYEASEEGRRKNGRNQTWLRTREVQFKLDAFNSINVKFEPPRYRKM